MLLYCMLHVVQRSLVISVNTSRSVFVLSCNESLHMSILCIGTSTVKVVDDIKTCMFLYENVYGFL